MFNFSTESKRGSKRRGRRRITGWTELRKGGLKNKNTGIFHLHKYKEQLLEKLFFRTYHGKILATGFPSYISRKNSCNMFSSLQVMEKILKQVFFHTFHKKSLQQAFFLTYHGKIFATGFLSDISRKNLCNRFFSLYIMEKFCN